MSLVHAPRARGISIDRFVSHHYFSDCWYYFYYFYYSKYSSSFSFYYSDFLSQVGSAWSLLLATTAVMALA